MELLQKKTLTISNTRYEKYQQSSKFFFSKNERSIEPFYLFLSLQNATEMYDHRLNIYSILLRWCIFVFLKKLKPKSQLSSMMAKPSIIKSQLFQYKLKPFLEWKFLYTSYHQNSVSKNLTGWILGKTNQITGNPYFE